MYKTNFPGILLIYNKCATQHKEDIYKTEYKTACLATNNTRHYGILEFHSIHSNNDNYKYHE